MVIQTHIQIGFANPYLVCNECRKKVPYWHDPDRCGCATQAFNYPCEHDLAITSLCESWSLVDGCTCKTPCKKP